MKVRLTLFLTTLVFAATFAIPGSAAEPKPPEKKAAPAPAKPKPYPLDVCIVTDNDLGSMGEETSIVYEGQVIKFCCAPCEKKFLKDPAKYLAKLAPAPAPAPAEPAKK